MNKCLSIIAGTSLAAALLAASGCGKHATVPQIAKDTKAFDAASAELKAEWNEVLSAAETNGYAVAILACKKIAKDGDLTDEQRKAAIDTQTAVMAAMREAAAKGDANAIDDVREVNQHWR
jgi:hypothetical protein